MPSNSDQSLEGAIQLRESGENEKARELLLTLLAEKPGDPTLNYQSAWVHDRLGREAEAVPYYRRAIDGGLPEVELMGAMLGLGSTYRALGRYDEAEAILRDGAKRFPDNHEFNVFLAMALYNMGQVEEGFSLLLKTLANTSADPEIGRLREAILFYSDHLDKVWR